MHFWERLLSGRNLLDIPMNEYNCIDKLDNVYVCPGASLEHLVHPGHKH